MWKGVLKKKITNAYHATGSNNFIFKTSNCITVFIVIMRMTVMTEQGPQDHMFGYDVSAVNQYDNNDIFTRRSVIDSFDR